MPIIAHLVECQTTDNQLYVSCYALLRFLQERKFTPLGATEPRHVNLRIIAATNEDLERKVAEGRFRDDLYWRLKVVPIHLPPLRQRKEDIPLLATHFLERIAGAEKAAPKELAMEAVIAMTGYSWPGNVRELENVVERMVVLNLQKEKLEAADLPQAIREALGKAEGEEGAHRSAQPYQDALDAFERNYFNRLFELTGGNISQAARISGVSRQKLHQKIKMLALDPERFRA